jgi:hypothetical protein
MSRPWTALSNGFHNNVTFGVYMFCCFPSKCLAPQVFTINRWGSGLRIHSADSELNTVGCCVVSGPRWCYYDCTVISILCGSVLRKNAVTGITKRCRLSLLTNCAPHTSPNAGGGGRIPMSNSCAHLYLTYAYWTLHSCSIYRTRWQRKDSVNFFYFCSFQMWRRRAD